MKSCATILTLSFFLTVCFTQKSLAQRFHGGIVAGMNASQIDGDSWSGYNKAGLVAGAFVYTQFTGKWKGNMEIRYSAKGSSTPKYYSYSRKFRLQYIEIPLIADFEAYKNLSFQAGVSLGYLFNSSQNDGYGYEKLEIDKSTEMAICAGINYSFFDNFDINVRYSYSIFPVFSDYTGQTYGTGAWYNNVITFALYFEIGD